jgi:DNA repair protein RecO (recombination protein O)
MRVQGQPAFVLHARAWRETSFIVEVLTQDYGRLALVARGMTGAKKHNQRAALQPMQFVRLDYQLKGEMASLQQVETIDVAPRLQGDSLLATFYIHELLLKLLPRQDAASDVFDLYQQTRSRLACREPLAWTLRRFERDLLQAIGVGFAFDVAHDGRACDSAARYRIDIEHGPVRDNRHSTGSVSGAALIALAQDQMPVDDQLQELRGALRGLIKEQLGNVELKSWGLLSELARVGKISE